MATFKELSANDIKTARSFLNQLVDVVQEDISGSTTRKKFQVFVTGGIGPGVTSSLFQTIYDQDFSLQTSNAIFDMSIGSFYSGSTVQDVKTGEDSAGKLLFPSWSMMMREKTDVYKQFAQTLLGDAERPFYAPFSSTDSTAPYGSTDRIDDAMFVNFKRLFHRDGIKRETFAMKMHMSSSNTITNGSAYSGLEPNLHITTGTGSAIFTDVGAASNQERAFGGQVGNIVDSSNTNRNVGLMFYDRGIAILDASKVMQADQLVSGTVDAMSNSGVPSNGKHNMNDTFIPGFWRSGSVDNIIDHIASTRFQSGSLTAMTFQNKTAINSTLFFCRAGADEFNYSANPTYTDSQNRIVVIDEGQEDSQQSFTMATTIGMYDANDNLLAVAKLSRPVEKNFEKDITFRVRLDY